jgi:hypothetical protein
MNPPMTWARVWRIIRFVQVKGLPKTPGLLKSLYFEIERMDQDQRSRFYDECSGVLGAA